MESHILHSARRLKAAPPLAVPSGVAAKIFGGKTVRFVPDFRCGTASARKFHSFWCPRFQCGTVQVQSALLFGQAAVLGLMPALAAMGGRAALFGLSASMAAVGVLQAPLVPGLSPLERVWMPPGPERALSLRIPHLGNRLSGNDIRRVPLFN
eukprot:SAG31_NODE_1914_length_6931_cov_6.490340_4_plen_153_part_00